MKLKTGISLVLISFILFSNMSSASNLGIYKDLDTTIKASEQNDIQIKEWNIYFRIMKENIDEKALNQIISSIIRDSSYTWTEEGEENHHKTITGTKRKNKDERKFIISFIKKGELYYLSLSYLIKSNANLNIKKISSLNIPTQFKNESRYITVLGSTKEGEDLKQVSNNILHSLSATYVEGLQEEKFISVSGLTNKWDHHLKTENGMTFNVQVGLRQSEDGTIQATIGTPIITTEY